MDTTVPRTNTVLPFVGYNLVLATALIIMAWHIKLEGTTGWQWYWVAIGVTQTLSLLIHIAVHTRQQGGGKIDRWLSRIQGRGGEFLRANFHLVWMLMIDGAALLLLYLSTGNLHLTLVWVLVAFLWEQYSLGAHQFAVRHDSPLRWFGEPLILSTALVVLLPAFHIALHTH